MNNIEKQIENKYNELINKIDQDILFSVLQSPYWKTVTNKYRDWILHYISASILMNETWKLKCNTSKDRYHISVEWVDDIFNEAKKYLDWFDDEMKRITINNTWAFPEIVWMVISISWEKDEDEEIELLDDKWNYTDKINLDAEELLQEIDERIEKWWWKWSIEKRLKKYLEIFPYHWGFYMSMYTLTWDLKHILEWFEKAKEKVFKDCKWKWPKTILWWYTDNRPLLSLIKNYSTALWIMYNLSEAEDILKLLLKLNKNDNQGNRYDLLAIKEWLSYDEFIEKFDKWWYFDNEISEWFSKNVKKYKDIKWFRD